MVNTFTSFVTKKKKTHLQHPVLAMLLTFVHVSDVASNMLEKQGQLWFRSNEYKSAHVARHFADGNHSILDLA